MRNSKFTVIKMCNLLKHSMINDDLIKTLIVMAVPKTILEVG